MQKLLLFNGDMLVKFNNFSECYNICLFNFMKIFCCAYDDK